MTGKKRGAPPGNKNALKHGFYSRAFTKGEQREGESAAKGRLQPEIDLLKVLIARTAARLKPNGNNPPPPFNKSLSMLFVVSMAITRLNSFYRTNDKLFAASDDSLIEFLKALGLNQEEIDQEMYGSGERTRGGQIGNTNALKHGFYASAFKPEEIRKLDKMDKNEIDDEIALLRVLIKRTFISMYSQSDLDIFSTQRGIRVIIFAASCVEKLERNKMLVFGKSTGLDKMIKDSIREATEELGISV